MRYLIVLSALVAGSLQRRRQPRLGRSDGLAAGEAGSGETCSGHG